MSETKVHLEHHGPDGLVAVVTADSAAVALNEYRTLLTGLASTPNTSASEPDKASDEESETPVPDLDEAREKEEKKKEAKRKAAETRRKKKEAEEAAAAEPESDSDDSDDFDFGDETDAADVEPPSEDDVRKALVPLGRSKGIPLLKEFGAAKISQVKVEDRAKLVAKAQELAAKAA